MSVYFVVRQPPVTGAVIVQAAKEISQNTVVTTQALAFTANVTAGSTLIATVNYNVASYVYISSVKDNLNTPNWALAYATYAGAYQVSAIYYYYNTLGGPCTVTLTLSAGVTAPDLAIMEVGGLSNSLDGIGHNSGGGSTGTFSGGTIYTIDPNEFIISTVSDASCSAGASGWTFKGFAAPATGALQTIIGSTPGTFTPNFTLGGTGNWASATASFIPTGGVPSPIVQRPLSNSINNVLTVSQAYNSAVTAGNCLIAIIGWGAATGTVTSVKDNVNNTNFTLAGTLEQANGSTVGIYYYLNTLAGTPTVTLTTGGSNKPNIWITVMEVSGLTGVLDGTSANTGSSTSATPGLITTTAANDVVIHAAYGVTGYGATGASGWTAFISSFMDTQYLPKAAVGAYNPAFTYASSQQWTSVIAAFKHT